MPTGAPLICRTCGEAIAEKNGSRYCRNGCQIYTAQPVGAEYGTPRTAEQGSDGRLWERGGSVGNIRKLPTCRD